MNTQVVANTSNRYIIYCRKSSESDERQVQSLTDQMNTLLPIVQQRGLHVIGEPLQESKSAKSPGRPVFDQMISLIEEGQANGIILLNPSRLSRNTVDTGRIIFLMDQGKLEEVVTPYQTFKNNPYDKFMLNLLCTQAKLENDNKSVNVKDALHYKAERGDFPGKARAGYMNNHGKNQGHRDISPHPVYFPLMRKLVDLALTGNYSVEALCRKAEEMGIRYANSGRIIGKSSLHRYLRDPFYIGKFWYKGKLYKGNHQPLMTEAEFLLLQDILDGKSKGKQKKHEFALNGLIKCGECQYCVTGEAHTKTYKNGTSQTFAYYRCTKKGKVKKCNQPFVSSKKLEDTVIEELQKLQLDDEFTAWALEALEDVKQKEQSIDEDRSQALQTALDGVIKRMNNLLALKISPENSDGSLLSDTEYSEKKQLLTKEKEKIQQQLHVINPQNTEWADLAKDGFDFGLLAARRFKYGEVMDKKLIVRTVGSNLILLHQDLLFQLRFLFLKYKEGSERTVAEMKRLEPENRLQSQANPEVFVKSCIWYRVRESNP